MAKQFININFPFRNSEKGFLLDLTETDADAIKSDLMHLVLTNKGERYYNPEFGTNLRKYIFEQNDRITHSEITEELNETIKKFIPNLLINNVLIEGSPEMEYLATVKISYTITDGVFNKSDFIIINL